MRAVDLFANYQNSLNWQITKTNDLLTSYRKRINSPYKKKDIIPVVGTIIILVSLPITVFAIKSARDFLARAAGPAAIEAENSSLSGPVSVGNDAQASAGQFIQFGSTVTTPPGSNFSFGAAGDHGDGSAATASLNSVAGDSDIQFYLALGDMSYNAGETRWCNYVKGIVGTTFPFQLITGNHEDEAGDPDGFIDNFASCLPDRLGSTGNYGHQYYFDYPTGAPLMRVIMADVDLRLSGSTQEYCHRESSNCNWLRSRIQEAKAQNLWVVVGMHKVCLSIGNKTGCAINQEIVDMMIAEGVDLVLQAHDHDYQRSHSLSCAQAGTFLSACVADNGADGLYSKGAGTVFVIQGTFGRGLTPLKTGDSEFGYFAAWAGGSGTNTGVSRANGYVKYTVTAGSIVARFVPTSGGSYTDGFTITSTLTSTPAPTPTPTPTPTPSVQARYLGTFWYPWFGGANTPDPFNWRHWKNSGHSPPQTWRANFLPDYEPQIFDPSVELYASGDTQVMLWQLDGMKRAGFHFMTSYWPGIGSYHDQVFRKMFTDVMKRPDNPNKTIKWSLSYQKDHNGDPSPSEIVTDLRYIRDNYATDSDYFKINGKFVVNVFSNSTTDGHEYVDRWASARNTINSESGPGKPGIHVILKVYTNISETWRDREFDVDGWYQYAPSNRRNTHLPYSVNVSPGFSKQHDCTKFLTRDLTAFNAELDYLRTVESQLLLISSWNEWAEGHQVEPGEPVVHNCDGTHPAGSFVSAGPSYGYQFVDAIQNRLASQIPNPFVVSPDTTPPTAPTNLTTTAVSGTQVNLSWTASTDNVGVTGYKIFRNGSQIDTSPTNSYSDTSVSPSTTYSYEVSAFDAAGNESAKSSSASVTTPCSSLPTDKGVATQSVSLEAGTYKIWSRIKAPDSTNNSYYLQIDGDCGTVVGDSAITADAWTWVDYKDGSISSKITFSLSSGNHTIKMIGRESSVKLDRIIFADDLTCTPTGFGDNCLGGGDNLPPSISITEPADGQTVSGLVAINADAIDNFGVTKVHFIIDGVLKLSDTNPPYSYSWDTTGVTDGAHTIEAKAFDAANKSSTDTIAVTVSNPISKPGDLNFDGIVDIFDLSILLSNWGTSDPSADINQDGIVDIFDLSNLLSNWGGVKSLTNK